MQNLPIKFNVKANYEFHWHKAGDSEVWTGEGYFADVKLPFMLIISAVLKQENNDRRAMIITTNENENPVLDQLYMSNVAAAQNYLQAQVIIRHQESKID